VRGLKRDDTLVRVMPAASGPAGASGWSIRFAGRLAPFAVPRSCFVPCRVPHALSSRGHYSRRSGDVGKYGVLYQAAPAAVRRIPTPGTAARYVVTRGRAAPNDGRRRARTVQKDPPVGRIPVSRRAFGAESV